ncbi:multidrug effflux MFS transporter [Cognatishimia sp. SS12]|uniref:multidrug effflux MFS transporter n=1 Tax=Cognatishimia sp. SS12 TaxID=2979465 RepID=UPI002330D4A1|nr:multidrug effflux MFS transporter [Cognatishimia sp. SS12]MDC0739621.1 multidrug effflux MFS transporter [Cognatishimia sp. SS12]
MQHSFTRIAVTLGLISLVGPLTIDMYLPALPAIADELGASIGEVHWTITAFLLGFGPAQLIYGPLSDHFGRKAPLYLGLTLYITGTLAIFFAPNIELLTFARVLQGFGGAVAVILPRTVVRDLYTGVEATRLTGLMMMLISVSPMLAPLLGSLVLLVGGWRTIFFVLSVFGFLCLFLTAYKLPETLPKQNRVSFTPRTFFAGTRRLFTDPLFMGLTVLGACSMTTFYVFIANASFVYIGQFGLTQMQFGVAFALNGVGFFCASRIAAPLAQRFGIPRVIKATALIFAILLLGLTLLLSFGLQSLVAIMITFFVAYGLQGVIVPTSTVLALEKNGDIAGLASSWMGVLRVLLTGTTIALSEPFVDGTALPMVAIIAVVGILALVTTQIVLSERRHPLQPCERE